MKVDKLLEKHKQPKPTQEKVENLNRHRTEKEIAYQFFFKLQQIWAQDHTASLMTSTKCLKKNQYQYSNSSKKLKSKRWKTLPNSFYEASYYPGTKTRQKHH